MWLSLARVLSKKEKIDMAALWLLSVEATIDAVTGSRHALSQSENLLLLPEGITPLSTACFNIIHC
jgi:hypothetical protein